METLEIYDVELANLIESLKDVKNGNPIGIHAQKAIEALRIARKEIQPIIKHLKLKGV